MELKKRVKNGSGIGNSPEFRGIPSGKHNQGEDGMWLSGHDSNSVDDSCEQMLSIKFGMGRDKLAKQLKVFKEKGMETRMATDEFLLRGDESLY